VGFSTARCWVELKAVIDKKDMVLVTEFNPVSPIIELISQVDLSPNP
jgi:hypothetical protein